MGMPAVEIEIQTHQFRDALGRFARYSEELRRTRLEPWAKVMAEWMKLYIREEIPSRTVAYSFMEDVSFEPGPAGGGGGTRVTFTLPGGPEGDWNRLALWLLEGTAPHIIEPRYKLALWWGYSAERIETRGAPNRPAREIYQPEHPLRFVVHPGFRGYDYLGAIEKKTLEEGLLGAGGAATMFARDATLKLTPRGPRESALMHRRFMGQILSAIFPDRPGLQLAARGL